MHEDIAERDDPLVIGETGRGWEINSGELSECLASYGQLTFDGRTQHGIALVIRIGLTCDKRRHRFGCLGDVIKVLLRFKPHKPGSCWTQQPVENKGSLLRWQLPGPQGAQKRLEVL